MKDVFRVGDVLEYRRVVEPNDVAIFQDRVIHPVCATFALARDIEWTSRQFILQMCDADEEGIGTLLTIDHRNPAFVGEEIVFTARIHELLSNQLVCTYQATVGDRLIASGKTGQRILKRERINKVFTQK